MPLEIRGPFPPGASWDVLVDGKAVPGYVELLDGQYRVNLGGMRGMPSAQGRREAPRLCLALCGWAPFDTLDEAVQPRDRGQSPPAERTGPGEALVAFHARGPTAS